MNKKRLYKSSRNKKICGVCGGIAEYLNIDPTVIRLITAIIGLAWGSGILLYIIMAFVMPYDNEITY
ncbi:PspC domain-containing protein [Eubacterium ventriosum]|jgi:phage shock protein C|uniref:PspC domain-containing protein n=1 Tax=Eubacterium ventriosum TaxID=39496 RepID=A0A415L512_9FIRM|nr:PspC domain-containing protein [Eubacterium ventriosum]RHL43633.1 PspC domain-containing protein [Eubacterium ventriosum]